MENAILMVLQYFILQPMCTIIQIQGHNRARQRDKLGQVLEELSNLQDEVKKSTRHSKIYLFIAVTTQLDT